LNCLPGSAGFLGSWETPTLAFFCLPLCARP
jgi:hypothetical protein